MNLEIFNLGLLIIAVGTFVHGIPVTYVCWVAFETKAGIDMELMKQNKVMRMLCRIGCIATWIGVCVLTLGYASNPSTNHAF